MDGRENYLDYVANRPGVKALGEHGLWDAHGKVPSLENAVAEVARQGISPFCLTLDPQADAYVAQIFGARGYQILDRIDRLPERLPRLYAGLARQG